MNISLPRLALVASFFAALVTGIPTTFADEGPHKATAVTAGLTGTAYLPYQGGVGDPLGLTASDTDEFDDEALAASAETPNPSPISATSVTRAG